MNHCKISGSAIKKTIEILAKPYQERDSEEVHYLSMLFKKKILEDRQIDDWWFLYRCIQSLRVQQGSSGKNLQVEWIYVVQGSFTYHDMVYATDQCLTLEKDDSGHLNLDKSSTYLILTRKAYQEAKQSADDHKITQQKQFIRGLLFGKMELTNREFYQFWQVMFALKVPKGQQLSMDKFQDSIFIVVGGSLKLQYPWKRNIPLRELGEGSLFSTYLGRYFYRTSEQLKNEKKYLFKYTAHEEAYILGISIDLFYQNPKLSRFRFLINKVWNEYLDRVAELNRIIESLGTMKPEKKEVQKSLKQQFEEKELRERAISVPVAIQKRKFRKIIYNFFDERSNRRKVPNLAVKSARTLPTVASQITPKKRIQTQQTGTNGSLTHRHTRSATYSIQRAKQDKFNTLSTSAGKLKTISNTIEINPETENQRTKFIKIGNFFKPDQFVSKKLKNHYESILVKLQKLESLRIPVGITEHSDLKKKFKNEKQYFEYYVNERRIVKLGPKKRILYKKRAGF